MLRFFEKINPDFKTLCFLALANLVLVALFLSLFFSSLPAVYAHDERLPPQYPRQQPADVQASSTFTAVISSVSPALPQCVYRTSANAAERTVTLNGQNLYESNYSLEFQNISTGQSTNFLAMEASWSATKITLDVQRVAGAMFPNIPKVQLQVRLRAYIAGRFEIASDWSPSFLLADDAATCYATPQTIKVLPPPTRTINVYVMNFEPFINSQLLHNYGGWAAPSDLTSAYITDVTTSSGGVVNYQIVKWSDIRTYPFKPNNYVFTTDEYKACLNTKGASSQRCLDIIDYKATLQYAYDQEYGSACQAILDKNVDEIWLWGGPWFGYWEFLPVTVRNYCNVSGRNKEFTVMGFNYERGVAEMLHDLGHRSEAALQPGIGMTLWNKFDGQWTRTTPDVDPANTHCGNVHYPPNAQKDYEYSRNLPVLSDCDDWLNYPNLTGQKQNINYTTWCAPGGDCPRGYLKWWFSHFPRQNDWDEQRLLNWWHYLFPYATPLLDQTEASVTVNMDVIGENATFSIKGKDFKPGLVIMRSDTATSFPTTVVSNTLLNFTIPKTTLTEITKPLSLMVVVPQPYNGITLNYILTITLIYNPTPVLTLTSLPNPANFGENVTFTATISPITATGNIQFVFGEASAAITVSSLLSNGVATYVTNTLLPGETPVVAKYNGNAELQAASSSVYTQTVVLVCDPFIVTSSSDDGQASTCGMFSYALLKASTGTTITFALTQTNTINFTNTLILPLASGVNIDGGENGVILDGNGLSGSGLKLSGHNRLSRLTLRHFSGPELLLLPGATANWLHRVKLEN